MSTKTDVQKLSIRWVKKIARLIDTAQYHVACTEEAHVHYGEWFTRMDACWYYTRGMLTELLIKIRLMKSNGYCYWRDRARKTLKTTH